MPYNKKVTKVVTLQEKFNAKTGPTQCYIEEKAGWEEAVKIGGFSSMSDFQRRACRELAERLGVSMPPESDYIKSPEPATE